MLCAFRMRNSVSLIWSIMTVAFAKALERLTRALGSVVRVMLLITTAEALHSTTEVILRLAGFAVNRDSPLSRYPTAP
jgi:hypothetical protein